MRKRDGIHLAFDRNKFPAVMNVVMDRAANFLVFTVVQWCWDMALLSDGSRQFLVSSVWVEMLETDRPAKQRHVPRERRY